MEIRRLDANDQAAWLQLRQALWPDEALEQLGKEMPPIAADSRQLALGAFIDGALIGFVEFSLHPHAVGCTTTPVGYLEAWYVAPQHRGCGVGRALVSAGEQWAKSQGCRELASDTWLENEVSHHAHQALGFTETRRMIHYRKLL